MPQILKLKSFASYLLNVPTELEAVFQQRQLRYITLGAGSLYLGHDASQLVAVHGLVKGGLEFLCRMYRLGLGNTCCTGERRQVAAGGCGRGKTADGKQAFVVEDHMHQFLRTITRERCKAAQVHQDGAISIEDHDALLRQAEGQSEAGGRRQSHGVLQIKEI